MRARGVAPHGAVVVVTGASSGIGRITAEQLAGRGARLVLGARNHAALEEVAELCRTRGGPGAAVVTAPVDVTDPGDHERLVERALAEFGRIDAWVNNAAVMSYGTVSETPVEVQRRVVEVNLLGQMWAAHAVVPVFERQRRGVLVNVASLYGRVSTPYVSGYSASKFGVLGFTRCLRQELRGLPDVAVCAVLPGSADTPIFRHAANLTGRRARPVPPVCPPERVAHAIVGVLENPRREVAVGRLQHLVTVLRPLAPAAYEALTPAAMRLVGLGRSPEAPHLGNLFEPDPRGEAAHGGWRHPRRRRVAAGLAGTALLAVLGRRVRRASAA